MLIWIDAQLSPHLAPWLERQFEVSAVSLARVGLRDSTDPGVYFAARSAGAVVLTKDEDFPQLQAKHGPPPSIIWVTCGNTSNARLRTVFTSELPRAIALIDGGEPLVEIGERP